MSGAVGTLVFVVCLVVVAGCWGLLARSGQRARQEADPALLQRAVRNDVLVFALQLLAAGIGTYAGLKSFDNIMLGPGLFLALLQFSAYALWTMHVRHVVQPRTQSESSAGHPGDSTQGFGQT